jgi:hypothetical protein
MKRKAKSREHVCNDLVFERRWEKNHVASMSRGAAGKNWEALKTNGNFCDMTRHEIDGNAS